MSKTYTAVFSVPDDISAKLVNYINNNDINVSGLVGQLVVDHFTIPTEPKVCTMTDEAIVGFIYQGLTIDKWSMSRINDELISAGYGITVEKVLHCYGVLVLSGALRHL
jgi:hypothetical protein